MGPLLAIAAGLIPELFKVLAADKDQNVSSLVIDKIKDIVKTEDPAKVQHEIQENSVMRAELQKELAQIAFEATKEQNRADAEQRRADFDVLKEEFAEADREWKRQIEGIRLDMESQKAAQTNWLDLAKLGSPMAWINPLLSVVITAGFLYILWELMTSTKTMANKEVFNIALGALATAFATVIGFHFGSSSGSKDKDSVNKMLLTENAELTRRQSGGVIDSGVIPDKPSSGPIITAPVGSGPRALFRSKAPGIMRNLMSDFGLTAAQAAGVLGNIGHECGGFKLMQEVKPLVSGSLGGFGWCQWTGPRRRQFKAWADEHGMSMTSDEANYGFLKHELTETSESKVIQPLRRADTVGEATETFSRVFLRPGIPHLKSRVEWAELALKTFNG